MLDHKRIIERASQLFGSKLTPQATAVLTAIVDAINEAIEEKKRLQLLERQANAASHTATGRMRRPTVEDVKTHGKTISLPEYECERFFDHFESNGWRVGMAKSPMKLWTAALANWKRTWQERNLVQSGDQHLSAMDKRIMFDEYEKCQKRIESIRLQYSGLQTWSDSDRQEFKTVKARREELKTKLDIRI